MNAQPEARIISVKHLLTIIPKTDLVGHRSATMLLARLEAALAALSPAPWYKRLFS